MRTRPFTPPSRSHEQDWRTAYESVLLETDKYVLFTRVEVAEAAMLTQRESLVHHAERQELEDALIQLRAVKRERFGFTT
jgi:hypothetical protein